MILQIMALNAKISLFISIGLFYAVPLKQQLLAIQPICKISLIRQLDCFTYTNAKAFTDLSVAFLQILNVVTFSGICMRRRDAFDRDALHFAPYLLLPSPFPRKDFDRSLELQPVLNELMHKGLFY